MTLLAGKYRLERVLGQGGMGVVVSALHVALDERVAIKLLLPEALANRETVVRFQREARAAVRIKSEHVAHVLDVGEVDPAAASLQATLGVPLTPGAPFMVMEYLEGQDLAALLQATGPLPLGDAVAYVAQAIEAIAEAHALGIVHRDLKPSNLFLARRPDGTPLVKVLDFGISKAAATGALDAAITTTSAVLGSPMYMAPEQMIASRETDARTDIWALGVVLYQLLSGHGPFQGTTMTELCARIIQEPHAPLRATRPDVPVEIEAIVARCLEKDRVRRFGSVADLAEALVPFDGPAAALSAERARRLLPRTERAVVASQPPLPATVYAATPYAATNASWSATRGRNGSKAGAWLALAFGLALLLAGAGVVVLALAFRARSTVGRDTHATATSEPAERTAAAPPPAALSTVELAPLRSSDRPAVEPPTPTHAARVPARATPRAAVPSATGAAPPPTHPAEPPPSPKPDIF